MEKEIGQVTHFFNKINVAVIAIKGALKVGDTVHILGHTTDFTQKITSMQIDHKNVEAVKTGDDFAMKVDEPVREQDVVYLVEEDA